jgi:hypothetical protein
METMVKTDTNGGAMMNSWSQRSSQQDYCQSVVALPVAMSVEIPHSQAHFAHGFAQHQPPTFQHRQSFAASSAYNSYSFRTNSQQTTPRNNHQFHALPPSYGHAMAHADQEPNLQIQRFQDELESLMMATDATLPDELQSRAVWSHDNDTGAGFGQVEFVENSWQPSTSPIDRKVNPDVVFMMADDIVPFDRADTRVQPQDSLPHPFPCSFASDGTDQDLASYPFNTFGSYSDRSDMADSFSPISPAEIPFGSHFDVRIRRNSDDQMLFHGLPLRDVEERNMASWNADACSQSDWFVRDGRETSATQLNSTQHSQQNLAILARPNPILHSQRSYSSLASPEQIETEHDFGSPDLEDNFPRSNGRQNSVSQSLQTVQSRDARDDFLVQLRRRGLPYREIKIKGGYTEAESTLRGRFRTLTKDKNDRVRKPHWQPEDVSPTSSSLLKPF